MNRQKGIVEENGHISAVTDKYSKRYYLIRKADKEVIAAYLNSFLECGDVDNAEE